MRDLVEAFERLASLEQSHRRSGILQNFNPLLKIITFGLFISSALFVNSLAPILFMAVSIVSLAILTRINIKDFAYRSSFIPAFALIISIPILFTTPGTEVLRINGFQFTMSVSEQGIMKVLIFAGRVWVCVATIVLVTSTTDLVIMIRALKRMKAPKFFTAIAFMTYRYLFLTLHEVYSLLLAKESRAFTRKRTLNLKSLKYLGNSFASLFIRAYERSERVYLAMVARGYTGLGDDLGNANFRHGPNDMALGVLIVTLGIFAILLNIMHVG